MKERNHAFDFLCGICIIRMILNHVVGMTGGSDYDWWQETMFWTFFFMSFFFFKAGYFNKTVGGDSWQFCVDKAKRLLVPYFVWGTIGCVAYFFFVPFMIMNYKHPVEPLHWEHIWKVSYFYGNSPCWFLMSFFTAYIAMHFIEKVKGLHWLVLLFPFMSYWLFLHDNPLWLSMSNVFMGVFFFFLGRVWHWLLARLRRRNTMLISAGLIMLFVVLNILFHGEYDMSSNHWEGNPVMMVVNTAVALCGISGVLLSSKMNRVPVINYIGQHSMVYFVAHYPMLIIYRFVRLSFKHSIYGKGDDTIILLIVTFCLCTWLVPYVESVPWLSGRFPKKEKRRAVEEGNLAPALACE